PAIAADAGLVAERLTQRLAEADADVLDGVMGVHVQVALGLDVEIDEAVARQQVEHVVEEADAGGELGIAGAVQVEAKRDLGLGGVACDLSGAWGGHGITFNSCSKRSISASLPTLMRKPSPWPG